MLTRPEHPSYFGSLNPQGCPTPSTTDPGSPIISWTQPEPSLPAAQSPLLLAADTDQRKAAVRECLKFIQHLQQILDATDPLTSIGQDKGKVPGPKGSKTHATESPASLDSPEIPEISGLKDGGIETIKSQLANLVGTGEKWTQAYQELRQLYERLQGKWRVIQETVMEPTTGSEGAPMDPATADVAAEEESRLATVPVDPDTLSVDSKRSSVCEEPHSQRFQSKFRQYKDHLLHLQNSGIDKLGKAAGRYFQRLETICCDLNEEAGELEQRIATLQGLREQDQAILIEKDRTLSRYVENATTLEQYLDQLRETLAQEKAQREALEAQLARSHTSIKRELEDAQRQCSDYQTRVEGLQIDLDLRGTEVTTERQRAQRCQAALDTANQQLGQVQRDYDTLKASSEATQSVHHDALQTKDIQIRQLQATAQERQAEAQRTSAELGRCTLQLKQRETELVDVRATLELQTAQKQRWDTLARHSLVPLGFNSDLPLDLELPRFAESLRETRTRHEREISQHVRQLEEHRKAHAAQAAAYREQEQRLQGELEQMRTSHAALQSEYQAAGKVFQKTHQAKLDLERQLARAEAECHNLGQAAHDQRHTLQSQQRLQLETDQYRRALLQTTARCEALMARFTQQIRDEDQRTVALRSRVQGLESRLISLGRSWRVHVSGHRSLNAKWQAGVKQIKEAESKLNAEIRQHAETRQTLRRMEDQYHLASDSQGVHSDTIRRLEDRCLYWQEKVRTLQKSVTGAMEDKSRAMMDAQRAQLELEQRKMEDWGTGSTCGSLLGGAGGNAPSVTSVSSMVRRRRFQTTGGARGHPYPTGPTLLGPGPMSPSAGSTTHIPPPASSSTSTAANTPRERNVFRTPALPVSMTSSTTDISPDMLNSRTRPISSLSVVSHPSDSASDRFWTPTPTLKRKNSGDSDKSVYSARSSIYSRRSTFLGSRPPVYTPTYDGLGSLASSGTNNLTPHSSMPPPAFPLARPATAGTSTVLEAGKRIRVAFSGFDHDDASPYDRRMRDRLSNQITALGGEVVHGIRDLGDSLQGRITHLITPTRNRTFKMLAAALASIWIITDGDTWITESTRVGRFVSEAPYGNRHTTKPFAGKTLYIAPSFRQHADNANRVANGRRLFTEYGEGSTTDNPDEADYCLVDTGDTTVFSRGQAINYAQFIGMIPGSEVRVSASSALPR
ncbi:hypothetical protein H4R33_003893 [Dimargaris cristalligena]|nr:hypothetical protein H4R33_003893 [Dimargaris cristalligena]